MPPSPTDQTRFRKATLNDISALHRLIESAYRGESSKRGWTHEADLLGGQRTDPDLLASIIEDSNQVILLVTSDKRIIACVQLSRIDEDCAYLGLLTVDPTLQAGGIGKQLLSAAEDYSRKEWNVKAIEMTVIRQRTELVAYYERRGYVLKGERRPFPMEDPRCGLPKTDALEFTVLRKDI